jgi:isoquinoline 1-oxidoreductase
VLHQLPDVAEQALDRIETEYDPSTSVLDDKNIFEHLLKVATSSRVTHEGGNLDEGRAAAEKSFESTYLNGYVAHAPIEPHAALAEIEGDKATVWASTQTPFGLQGEVARAIGFPVGQVRVITPFVGGGFGGKSRNLQALWAARLAKIVKRPVQISATRDEEFYYDTFRPAAVVKINSGMDASGKIAFWDYDVACAGERGSQNFYAVPHQRTVSRDAPRGSSAHLFATGPWRAPGNNTNTYARESQIDIMAAAAGIDPVEFRLRNLTNPKYIGVLNAAAEKFGWTPAKGPSKRGYGVALGFDAGTYVCVMGEVAVDPVKYTVQVKRLVCIQDMGVVVNPQGAILQAEGCVTMGLGYALTEEVHFKNGRLFDVNFDSYEIPLFSWVPKIESGFIPSTAASQGGGEPAIIVMGAVIANAIFDACGARLMQLPATPERIQQALAAVPGR